MYVFDERDADAISQASKWGRARLEPDILVRTHSIIVGHTNPRPAISLREREQMISSIMLIVSGLVLLAGAMYVIPAVGKYLDKLGKYLGAFQTVIGIIAIIIGILEITHLDGVILVVVGLVLAVSILPMVPAIGKHMEKFAKFFTAYQVPLGIIAIILGII